MKVNRERDKRRPRHEKVVKKERERERPMKNMKNILIYHHAKEQTHKYCFISDPRK